MHAKLPWRLRQGGDPANLSYTYWQQSIPILKIPKGTHKELMVSIMESIQKIQESIGSPSEMIRIPLATGHHVIGAFVGRNLFKECLDEGMTVTEWCESKIQEGIKASNTKIPEAVRNNINLYFSKNTSLLNEEQKKEYAVKCQQLPLNLTLNQYLNQVVKLSQSIRQEPFKKHELEIIDKIIFTREVLTAPIFHALLSSAVRFADSNWTALLKEKRGNLEYAFLVNPRTQNLEIFLISEGENKFDPYFMEGETQIICPPEEYLKKCDQEYLNQILNTRKQTKATKILEDQQQSKLKELKNLHKEIMIGMEKLKIKLDDESHFLSDLSLIKNSVDKAISESQGTDKEFLLKLKQHMERIQRAQNSCVSNEKHLAKCDQIALDFLSLISDLRKQAGILELNGNQQKLEDILQLQDKQLKALRLEIELEKLKKDYQNAILKLR